MTQSDQPDNLQAANTIARGIHRNLLNDNQHRSLSVTLQRVEMAAWRLEETLTRQHLPQLALTRMINPFNEQQQETLLALARLLRQDIAWLTQAYDLAASEQNVSRMVMAEFTLLWSDLEDVRPRKLSRYGSVQSTLHQFLDPQLQHLLQLVLTIDAVGSGRMPPEQVFSEE
jgi:hypothetical protein